MSAGNAGRLRREAAALLFDGQYGDLQAVDQMAQTRLPFGLRRAFVSAHEDHPADIEHISHAER